jgi:putative nucleotidyltransferase with HDIG domain
MTAKSEPALLLFEEMRSSPRVGYWLRRLEEHDLELAHHSLLAGATASIFACSLNLDCHERKLLVIGTLLHDVGKLQISPSLLHKTEPLTSDERMELERHPVNGVRLLQEAGWEPEVLEIVHHHHERLNGSGYPLGLHKAQIGRLVQMAALCDIFSALIEDRSYRPSTRKPIGMMRLMKDQIDGPLLSEFSHVVPKVAYRVQSRLKYKTEDGLYSAVHS